MHYSNGGHVAYNHNGFNNYGNHVSYNRYPGHNGYYNYGGGRYAYNYGRYYRGYPYGGYAYRNYGRYYWPYAYGLGYFGYPYLSSFFGYPSSSYYYNSYPTYYQGDSPDYYANGDDGSYDNTYANVPTPGSYAVSRQPAADTAHLEVRLPDPQASIWVEGRSIASDGTVRQFDSPQLDPSRQFTYDVKAAWIDNGKLVTDERRVKVRANAASLVDFTRAADAGGQAPSELPLPQQSQ